MIILRSKIANFIAGNALKVGALMIPNPRSRSGRVMLNWCCFASFTLRSKIANFKAGNALKVGFSMIPIRGHAMVALCSIGVVLLRPHYGQKWPILVVPLLQALNIGGAPFALAHYS